MAQIMNDEQRAKALEGYNPQEHLISVGKDKQTGKVTYYYPAAWRLYELHLRYANANFKSEIIFHDEQKGTVIVKSYLYLGKDYAESDKKAEAMKQGTISSLDKVETAAKARCARDFGIGTEYALDMVADETDAQHTTPIEHTHSQQNGNEPVAASHNPLDKAKTNAIKVGFITGQTKEQLKASWDEQIIQLFGSRISDEALAKPANLARVSGSIEAFSRQRTSGK